MLTAAEKADGWKLMFDGKSLAGWRGYKTETPPEAGAPSTASWSALGGGGDLMTVEQYGDFEMRFEWKITEYGNSGIIYRIATTEPYPWHTGPEYQVLDNGHHPTARTPITSAGLELRRQPAGEGRHASRSASGTKAASWSKGNHVEHWLNGVKVVDYEFGSADWQQRVKASKFGKIPPYGTRQARLHRTAGPRQRRDVIATCKIKTADSDCQAGLGPWPDLQATSRGGTRASGSRSPASSW